MAYQAPPLGQPPTGFGSSPAPAKPKKGPKILLFIGIGLLVLATILGVTGIVMTARGVGNLTDFSTITSGQSPSLELESETEYGIAMYPYGSGNVTVYGPDSNPITVEPYTTGNVELQGGTLAATFTTGPAGSYTFYLTADDPSTEFYIIPDPLGTIGATAGGIGLLVGSGFVGFAGLVCLIIGLVWRSKQKKALAASTAFAQSVAAQQPQAPGGANPYAPHPNLFNN
ncbi:MAG: hypothetical protein LBM23_10805 [Propionibacteriaceae bacterium]|jgi:hypothetical protein|nr:hypothetical protein [Propionibacteriaceae bacterium]